MNIKIIDILFFPGKVTYMLFCEIPKQDSISVSVDRDSSNNSFKIKEKIHPFLYKKIISFMKNEFANMFTQGDY